MLLRVPKLRGALGAIAHSCRQLYPWIWTNIPTLLTSIDKPFGLFENSVMVSDPCQKVQKSRIGDHKTVKFLERLLPIHEFSADSSRIWLFKHLHPLWRVSELTYVFE